VCQEIVPEKQMPIDVGIAFLKKVKVVGAWPIDRLREVPPARDAQFAPRPITDPFKQVGVLVQELEAAHDPEQVQNRLGLDARDGGAANMVYGEQLWAKDGGDERGLQGSQRHPGRIMGDKNYGTGHG